MKINAQNLPAVPAPPASSRRGTTLAQVGSAEKKVVPGSDEPAAARPVRISRFPEEAALFAYSRHATLPPPVQPSQIDEYV
ncbi:MAG: hypothetical protein ACFHXK_14575 [bacterium]